LLFHFCLLFCAVDKLGYLRPLEDVTLNDIGLSAEFECEISKEGLKAEWFKGDKPIKASDKFNITSQGGVHRLVITDCQGEDDAKYTIAFKDVKSTAKLSVKGKCQ